MDELLDELDLLGDDDNNEGENYDNQSHMSLLTPPYTPYHTHILAHAPLHTLSHTLYPVTFPLTHPLTSHILSHIIHPLSHIMIRFFSYTHKGNYDRMGGMGEDDVSSMCILTVEEANSIAPLILPTTGFDVADYDSEQFKFT